MTIAIDPVSVWVDGEVKTAVALSIIGIRDDYQSFADNYYELRDATGSVLQRGNVTCSGQDYTGWNKANEWIAQWVAVQLNII